LSYLNQGRPGGVPSGSYPLRSGCTLKDSRASCLLITLSSSSAPASLSRSINPISGRICSWVTIQGVARGSGAHLGMFDERPQNSNVIYAISDEPMSAEEWKKQYVTDR
jgi:hypothetical protein